MIDSFSDVISKMEYHLEHKEEGYSIPLAPRYNKIVGNILPGQYTVVSGMQSSGKTSFVDENYVLNVLLQWYNSEEKPPLKIFYFSLKDTVLKKFQSLLCAYVKLVHNFRVDIPTLNSQPGRIYNIENEPVILKAIDDAEIFFNYIIDNEILQVISDIAKPTIINNTVSDYLTSVINNGTEPPFVMVVVDSTDHLAPETDSYHTLIGQDLDYKFDTYISSLVKDHNIHAVIITPASWASSRFPKENEPNYRQLGIYGKNCDKGVILYNPIAEGNINYLRIMSDYDDQTYINEDGLNTLRFWHVVRNSDGIESVNDRLLFIPGTSYMIETSMQLPIDNFNAVKNFLFNTELNPFYKNPEESDKDTELE